MAVKKKTFSISTHPTALLVGARRRWVDTLLLKVCWVTLYIVVNLILDAKMPSSFISLAEVASKRLSMKKMVVFTNDQSVYRSDVHIASPH